MDPFLVYQERMNTASRRAALLEAENLRTLGPDHLRISDTDLDELGRIALLVLVSEDRKLQEMSEEELAQLFDGLLSEEDLAVLDRVHKSLDQLK